MALKTANFVALDPAAETTGMTRGGRGDVAVFDEFGADSAAVSAAAAAIRANFDALDPPEAEAVEEEIAEAPEGQLLTRVHRVRERSHKLVARKKAAADSLACEACGFDFEAVYGQRGAGFVECHHTVPLASLRPGGRTRLADLALLCSNCHRMVHREAPWLSVDDLRGLLCESGEELNHPSHQRQR